MKFIIYLGIIFITLSACKKVVDIDIPESEKKIVVNGIFKADSIASIHISKSMNILDPINWYDLPVIEDADIQIYSGDDLLNVYYADYGFYISPEQVVIGNQYRIIIDAPPFEQVTAEVQIPERVNIFSIDTNSFYGQTYTMDSGFIDIFFYEAILKFKDPAEKKNYYIISCKAYYDQIYLDTFAIPLDDFIEDTSLVRIYADTVETIVKKFVFSGDQISINEVFPEEGIILNDDLINGKDSVKLSVIFEPDKLAISKLKYYFYLISITEDYYNYIVSREKSYSSNGPFTEPVQVLTNIKNGYGIVAGCTESIDSVVFGIDIIDRLRYSNILDYIKSFRDEEEGFY